MLLRDSKPQHPDPEDGYLLLTVLVLVFLMLLALSVAAPRVAKEIQRDKEMEAVQRGLQYRRAIKLYYKKFGNYPTEIKQLENTNQIRYLRKRYLDPMTGKDDWRLIHVGEAKVPPMGFFGEPLQGGLSSQSTGPGISGPGTGGVQNPSGATGTGSGSGFGFSNNNGANGNNGTGSSGGFGNFGSSGSSGSPGAPGVGSPTDGTGQTGTPGQPGSGTNGPGASTFGSSSTFGGGGPIVGVGIPMDKDSLLVYHKQKKYKLWEFVYDPRQDMMEGGAAGGNGNPAGVGPNGGGAPGTNPTSPGGGPGSGTSGSGFGNFGSSGSGNGGAGAGFGNFGSNPGTPAPPANPQGNPPSPPQ